MVHALSTLLAVSLVLASIASADPARTVSVTGEGALTVEPDIVRVQLGVFVFDKDLLKAKQKADKTMAGMLKAARELNVARDDVTATQLHVSPEYSFVEDKYEFLGYAITRSMVVTLRELPRLNELLKGCIEAGANRIEEIEPKTSKQNELEPQVRALAIAAAKKKAHETAKDFGLRTGKILKISTGSGPYVAALSTSIPAFGEATYHPGKIKISTRLDVVFELAD